LPTRGFAQHRNAPGLLSGAVAHNNGLEV
jgi:hypothetical protein